MMKVDLMQFTGNGGCASKIPPKQLEEFLKYLPLPQDPDILVSIDTHDDAGVYRVNDDESEHSNAAERPKNPDLRCARSHGI